jgi:hypothetical protein
MSSLQFFPGMSRALPDSVLEFPFDFACCVPDSHRLANLQLLDFVSQKLHWPSVGREFEL